MRTEIDLPDAQLRALDALADEVNSSRSELIARAVECFLSAKPHPAEPDAAFGLLAGRTVDGLDYQNRIRGEW